MNYYRISDGSQISKAQIDRNVSNAKKEVLQDQKNDYGYNFCQECAITGQPKGADPMELGILDCAHIISVDECQKTGKSEFAWDKSNIKILCRHHHKEFDKTNLQFKKSIA